MQKRHWKYAFFLIALVCGCLGCGAGQSVEQNEAEPDEETPVLTLYDKNSGSYRFDDRIAQEIMERTGVTIQVIDPTDDTDEKEELMYTYRDYPDLIKVDMGVISMYQEAGYLVDLEPYLSLMPSVAEMYAENLDRFRTADGRLYYLGNWYGKDEDAVSGFMIRYDYLTELVGSERADSDEPFTQEEFLALLREFSRAYPEVDGEPSIPFTTCLDYDFMGSMQGMYGLKTYYEEDGQLYHLSRAPRYTDMVSFLNQMYREGLMDKEWVVNRQELYVEKLESGRVFATACTYWDLQSVNTYLEEQEGSDAYFACYKVLGEGVSAAETTYGGRDSMGWDAIAITNHCENIDAALKVLDFLASEEGQYLMLWGIEGEDWDYVDGVHTPREEILTLVEQDVTAAVRATYIRRWIWCIKNGSGTDGTPYDMMTKYQPTRDAELANRRMSESDYWDKAEYLRLDPAAGTEESLMWANIENTYDKAFPKMVNAESEEAMLELYANMMTDMETEGLAEVEAVWTQKHTQRMIQWGN